MAESLRKGPRAQTGAPGFRQWSKKFLAELAATSNVSAAARKAGIGTGPQKSLFRKLDAEGLIARSGDMITILDRDRLCEIGQFKDRYDDLDLGWFKETA